MYRKKDLSIRQYQKYKKGLKKKARERYQNLSEDEKTKKQKYSHERYKNFPEDKKQSLVEYRKKQYKI